MLPLIDEEAFRDAFDPANGRPNKCTSSRLRRQRGVVGGSGAETRADDEDVIDHGAAVAPMDDDGRGRQDGSAGGGYCPRDLATSMSSDPGVHSPYLYEPWTLDAGSLAAAAPRFQAREIWRRLGVALATASRVAWHTHRDTRGSPFRGTGLREEHDPAITDAGGDPVEEAWTRPGWWAYQRLLRLLVNPVDATRGVVAAGVLPGGLTLPATPESDYYQWTLDTSSGADMLVILAFAVGTVADYVYVVLVDPTAASDLRVLFEVTRSDGEVWQVPSVPDSLTRGTAPPSGSGFFPQDAVAASWNERIEAWPSTRLTFRMLAEADDDPIVLLSSEPLSFRVLS